MNLNLFDQQQGKWPPGFREGRLRKLVRFVEQWKPDILVFQEVRRGKEGSPPKTSDGEWFRADYPHQHFTREMTGTKGHHYGYGLFSKTKPTRIFEDEFQFKGGAKRRALGAIWNPSGKACFGILNIHLSPQSSEVRQRESAFILDWLNEHQKQCPRWYVMGDFNADEKSKEMQMLASKGVKSLSELVVPTVSPSNSLRKIYGEGVTDQQIDWVLGYNAKGKARVVLNKPQGGVWISDHAGLLLTFEK